MKLVNRWMRASSHEKQALCAARQSLARQSCTRLLASRRYVLSALDRRVLDFFRRALNQRGELERLMRGEAIVTGTPTGAGAYRRPVRWRDSGRAEHAGPCRRERLGSLSSVRA